ncbi:hypothetical protein MAQ5080_00617 [Marinomonas aquimarina]|uniref:Porin domain-containing protein n=1 Tax=Marinomonas aquimarina TaxID=295068 RepID=A0A1A8T6P4_9GAMM|nr:hypothetical protein [Marinomonas aquimarina]SBS26779.1 hypothetical protein MAQ5080_00617 [Marinomonas aquimarina]
MKAIKLASVFAVSAVAAAVSTSTFALEPVFHGEAGVEYTSYYGNAKGNNDLADGTDLGEIELSVDTGVVYAELEVKTTGDDEGTDFNFEKLYVKQGAVSFGRFDGSVSTKAFMGMDEIHDGVDLRTDQGDTDNTGIRYKVADGLTVALEATTNSNDDSDIGAAISYVADLEGIKLGISGGAIGDANSVNVGAQFDAGPASISVNYGTGETGADTATTTTTDVQQAGASIEFAATEALTLTVEYAKDLEGAKDDGTYFIAEYAAGDLTYYFENYNGDLTTEQNIVGVKAYF